MKNLPLLIINSKGSKWFPLLITFMALVLYSYESYAGGVKWTGAIDSEWNTVGNWDGDPAGQDVTIDVLTNPPVITTNSNFTPKKITVKSGAQLTIGANLSNTSDFIVQDALTVVTITGGNIAIQKKLDLTNGATINMSGGTLTMDTETGPNAFTVNNAILNFSGGTISVNGTSPFDNLGTINASGTSSLEFNGTNTWDNTGTFLGTGGTVVMNGTTTLDDSGPTGTYTFYDLTINAAQTMNQGTGAGLDPTNINIAHDYTNLGGTFNFNDNTVTFNGSTVQTLTLDASDLFYDVVVNNSASYLDPNADFEISNSLTMTQGNIDMGVNKLILGTSTVNTGTLSYTAGSVIGQFERWINATGTAIDFPVGTATDNNMFTADFTNLTGGSLIVELIAADPGATGLPISEGGLNVNNQFTDGYWSVAAANSLASTNYDIELTGNGFSSYPVNSSTRILKRLNGGASWAFDGSHAAGAFPIAYRDGLSGISTAHFGLGYIATSPGNVSANLTLWLKAGDGTTGSPTVTAWNDQTLNGNNTTASGDPQLVANGINYNSAIDFDGTGDSFTTAATSLIGNDNPYTKIAVTVLDNTTGAHNLISSGVGGTHAMFFDNGTANPILYHGGTRITGLAATVGVPSIIANRYDAVAAAPNNFSRTDGVSVVNNGTFAFTDGGTMQIGQLEGFATEHDGYIAEAIVYNAEVSDADLLKIESYLAIKYGITLPGDYQASDATVLWNSTTNAAYHNDVTGIGLDNDSGLEQQKSLSSNSGGMVIMDKGASFSANLDFLLWGNDAGATTMTATDSHPFYANRLTREWKASTNGSPGTVTVRMIYAANTGIVADYGLHVDADGTFATGSTNYIASSISGDTITFNNISIADGDFFTLGEGSLLSPGGISTNLTLWLKAGAGVKNGGSTITSGAADEWENSVSNTNFTEVVDGDGTPTLVSSDMNYNPSVSFDGVDDEFIKYNFNSNVLFDTQDNTFFIVYRKMEEVPSEVMGGWEVDGGQDRNGYFEASSNGRLRADVGDDSDPDRVLVSTSNQNDKNVYATVYSDASDRFLYINGKEERQRNPGVLTHGSGDFTLGNRPESGTNYAPFYLSELVYYNRALNATEIAKVESYLALKYGVTPDNSGGGTDGDYIASDGTTVWDASTNATYHNDVTGIGRDDLAVLDQRKSLSSNSDGRVIIDKAAAFGADYDFLLWGNDDGVAAATESADVPGGVDARFGRVWLASEPTDIGSVNIQIDLTSLGAVTASDLRLLVDADGTFAAGATIVSGATLVSGSIYEFAGVTAITDGIFFTIATADAIQTPLLPPGPGGIFTNLALWLKADAGTTGTPTVTSWDDQSLSLNNTTASGDPQLVANGINYNPAIDFDGIDDSFTTAATSVIGNDNPYTKIAVMILDNVTGGHNVISAGTGGNHSMLFGAGTATTVLYHGGTRITASAVTIAVPSIIANRYDAVAAAPNNFSRTDGLSVVNNGNFPFTDGGTLQIGQLEGFTTEHDGYIGEAIVYNVEVSDAELLKIESYLAIKYGITLDNSAGATAGDYQASDATLLWDASANVTYHNDVTGIGRDDDSALDQQKSISSNSGSIVRVIMDKGGAFGTDRDFILWGNDAAAQTLTAVGKHPDYDNIMTRVWKAAVTGTPGTADLRMIFAANTGVIGNYAIHVDADGDFTAGATNFPASSINGDTITFSNVSLADGDFFTLGEVQRYPGNVSDQIVLWLKAGDGVEEAVGNPAEDGDAVNNWVDLSGVRTNDAVKSNSPIYRNNTTDNANYNPVVEFDGTNDGLNFGNDYIYSSGTGSEDGMTFFAVVKPDLTVTSKSEQYVFSFGPTLAATRAGYGGMIADDNGRLYGPPQFTYIGPPAYGPDNTTPILFRFTFDFDDTHQTIHLNGETTASRDNANTTTKLTAAEINEQATHQAASGPFTIGRQSVTGAINNNSGRYMQGSLAELIGYKKDVVSSEYLKIEAYLGIKYGIGLGGDYQASDATVIWDATTNAAYQFDVTGIGRDDKSTLAQQKSMNVSADAMVLMDHGTTFSSDLDFILWGNNDASPTPFSTLPDATNTYNVRIDRTWKTAVTGTPGSVTLQLVYPNTGIPTDYVLAVDADGDFSAGHVNYPVASISGDTLNFTNITFADGEYFSLGLSAVGPGYVAGNLRLWLKADAGTTGNPTVTAWDDQSLNANNTTASGDPQLVSNGINYNPALDFDAVGDYFATTNTSLIGDDNPYTKYVVVISDQFNPAGTFIASDGSGDHLFRHTTTGLTRSIHGGSSFVTGPQMTVGQASIAAFRYGATLNNIYRVDGEELIDNTTNAFTDGGTIEIGGNNSGGLLLDGYIAEALVYDIEVSDADLLKIESYLAIKYGTTLDNTAGGTAGDYTATDDTNIWDASTDAAAYHNDVIGIGRDDNSVLYQKQSHSADDTLNIYIDALAADNAANTGTITNDISYVVIGHDGEKLLGQLLNDITEMPAGVYTRFQREWKVTNTNFNETFSLEFEWEEEGAFNINDIRLLVDTDGDFSDATILSTADGLTFTVGSIIVGGISTAHIPANSTRYITIASAFSTTPLPIELVSFTAQPIENGAVQLAWQTASETNNDYFTIEKSRNAEDWQVVNTVAAAGNSTQPVSYTNIDENPYAGNSYYRLKQTDFDGQYSYSEIRLVNIDDFKGSPINVYPNPTNGQITIEGSKAEIANLRIYDLQGQDVGSLTKIVESTDFSLTLDISTLRKGMYLLETSTAVIKIFKD